MPTMWFDNVYPFIPGRGGREISACLHALMQQQQASDDKIYEGMTNMCNEIGCPLKFYEDTILPFEDTSGASADT